MMKAYLMTTCLFLAALDVFGEPFSSLSFDAALREAGKTHKIVLVDFYTTWCGPCKLLDANTWTDADVIELLQENSVALRIDAEVLTDLAARYKVEAYPTILLVKPDGTELDRLVGYRDAKTFKSEFKASLEGKDSIERAKDALEGAGANDPMARMNYASVLAQEGKYAEALEAYLWCFDHGLASHPEFVGVRLSFLLSDIKQLARDYPDATKALEERRDERQAGVLAGSGDRQMVIDLVRLNGVLDQRDKNVEVLHRLSAGNPLRGLVASMIRDQLMEAKRYQDVLEGLDPETAFATELAQLDRRLQALPADTPERSAIEDMMHSRTISTGVQYVEALAGLKRTQDARRLAMQILKFDSSAATRNLLAQAATRADNTALAHELPQK